MKKILLLPILLLLGFNSISQTIEKHHRVKVNTGQDGLVLMAQHGIAVDHGEIKKGFYFISDLSDTEIQIVRSLDLDYAVLIDDVTSYYKNRNKQDPAARAYTDKGCVDCPDYMKPANFSLGSMGGFFTYQEMLDILDSMQARFPNLITLKQSIGTYATTNGNPIYYVKISDNPNVEEDEPQVLYTALHHAREAQSLSQLIYYMWYLLENYETNPDIAQLLDNRALYFIPCLNPDGYLYNQSIEPDGGGMWRKNRKNNGSSYGVDLNRNYGSHWGYDDVGSSPNSFSEVYRGTEAFSEIETKAIRDFCIDHNFKIALNAHTYSNLLIYPYGFSASYQTADSTTFQCLAHEMITCSGFLAGTGDETVGYVTNGDSDDWMYDEQTTKNKIFSMTPEAGSSADGFWPMSSRIIPISKNTLLQNLMAARLAGAYAEVRPTATYHTTIADPSVTYQFKRIGLDTGTYTVSILPISPNILSVGASKTYTDPSINTIIEDAIDIEIAPSSTENVTIEYAIQWSHPSGMDFIDTFTAIYISFDTLFHNDGNTMAGFTSSQWNVTNSTYVSPTGSITESPSGNYAPNSSPSITTTNWIDLTHVNTAILTYYAKWKIEKSYDYVTISAATEGGAYTPLCGKYTNKGNDNQNNVSAMYDGIQDTWVKEEIDLSAFIGSKIKLRFVLKSDPGLELDGFNFDDFMVLTNTAPLAIPAYDNRNIQLANVPNPCTGMTTIYYKLSSSQSNAVLYITDVMGKIIDQKNVDHRQNEYNLDVSNYGSGIYFYYLQTAQVRSETKRMVVID